MNNESSKFVNDHILSKEELSILIKEKFQRLKEQFQNEKQLRKVVDEKLPNVIQSR